MSLCIVDMSCSILCLIVMSNLSLYCLLGISDLETVWFIIQIIIKFLHAYIWLLYSTSLYSCFGVLSMFLRLLYPLGSIRESYTL